MRTKAPATLDLVALRENSPERELRVETRPAFVHYAPDHIQVELVFGDVFGDARVRTAHFAFDPAETVAELFHRAVVVTDEDLGRHVEVLVDGEVVRGDSSVAKATIGGSITKKNASRHTVTVRAPHGSCRFRHVWFDVPGYRIFADRARPSFAPRTRGRKA